MSELPEVTDDFLDAGKKLAHTSQLSKRKRKGGRYTKKERIERRAEVYRLHFELGYSAEEISQMMKINRHTIQEDVKYLYSELAQKWNEPDMEGWLQKQVNRLEWQRNRLLSYLSEATDLEEKLSIERLVFDVDNRLAQIVTNTYANSISNWRTISKIVNDFAKEQKMKERWLSPFILVNTPTDKFERIMRILRGK